MQFKQFRNKKKGNFKFIAGSSDSNSSLSLDYSSGRGSLKQEKD